MTNNLKEEILEEARTKTDSKDPLVHIIWLIEGVRVHQVTNGERGHSVEDCKRYVLSNVLALINQKEKELLEELAKLAKNYAKNDPVVDLDPWAIPLVRVEDRIKQLKEELKEDV